MHLVIATRNRRKFGELKALLAQPGIHWHSLAEFPAAPTVREKGRTFDANAVKKACVTARAIGQTVLADDSGIEVDALGGAPGVRSARFAGGHGDDAANNAKLLRLLHRLPAAKRRARYRCALALADASGTLIATTRGTWSGRIAIQPAGRHGFGYDPIFLVPHLGKTVAQLPPSTKQRLSHRASAAHRMSPLLRRLVTTARG